MRGQKAIKRDRVGWLHSDTVTTDSAVAAGREFVTDTREAAAATVQTDVHRGARLQHRPAVVGFPTATF